MIYTTLPANNTHSCSGRHNVLSLFRMSLDNFHGRKEPTFKLINASLKSLKHQVELQRVNPPEQAREFLHQESEEVGILISTVHDVIRKRLRLHASKIQMRRQLRKRAVFGDVMLHQIDGNELFGTLYFHRLGNFSCQLMNLDTWATK